MTKQLYYEDAYLKEFDARVIASRDGENGIHLYLDKSAFFPEGGGQDGDRGYLLSDLYPGGKVAVTDTQSDGDDIYVVCDREANAVSKRGFPRGQECMAFWTGSSALTGCRIIPANTS